MIERGTSFNKGAVDAKGHSSANSMAVECSSFSPGEKAGMRASVKTDSWQLDEFGWLALILTPPRKWFNDQYVLVFSPREKEHPMHHSRLLSPLSGSRRIRQYAWDKTQK